MFDWNRFMFLESTTNLKPLVHRLSGRSVSSAAARGIAVCMQQGRLFFQSAERSPIEIRPLLLFYGTMAFAKALVASVSGTSVSTLPRAHGLKDTTSDSARLSELMLHIEGDGTFQHFNDVVARLSRLWFIDARGLYEHVPLPAASASDLKGIDLSLRDILARTPELESLYSDTFGEPALSQFMMLQRDDRGFWRVELHGCEPYSDRSSLATVVASLRARFPVLARWRVIEASRIGHRVVTFAGVPVPADELHEAGRLGEFVNRFVIVDPVESEPEFSLQREGVLSPTAGSFSSDCSRLISPFHGQYISEYALHYLGMYLLSSLVRYRPQAWVHAITRSATSDSPPDDHALALIEAFMELHSRAIPNLVAEVINPKT